MMLYTHKECTIQYTGMDALYTKMIYSLKHPNHHLASTRKPNGMQKSNNIYNLASTHKSNGCKNLITYIEQ